MDSSGCIILLLQMGLGDITFVRWRNIVQFSVCGVFLLCPVSFPAHLADVTLHIFSFLLWTHRVFTGFFYCLPGACLQLQYSGSVLPAEV